MDLLKKHNLLLTFIINFFVFVLVSCSSKEEVMVLVKGGEFLMGNNDGYFFAEQPVHKVYVDDFYIDKYEVTNAKYAAYLNAALTAGKILADSNGVTKDGNKLLNFDGSYCQISYASGRFLVESGKENYPVIMVTWYGAYAYAEYYGKRLPTEAEWEYAARGGSLSQGYTYSGSNNVEDVAWYKDNSTNPNNSIAEGKGTHKVGTKQPNELGIYDMSGNVWEWCNDWYDDKYYSSSTNSNPQGPTSGMARVLRGGSWDLSDSFLRCAYRLSLGLPFAGIQNFGFRCVR